MRACAECVSNISMSWSTASDEKSQTTMVTPTRHDASFFKNTSQKTVVTASFRFRDFSSTPLHNKLVRAVARRDADNRTISELIRFQDALERLGLLWTPLDALDKYQAQELVRNLHVSTAVGSQRCCVGASSTAEQATMRHRKIATRSYYAIRLSETVST